MNKKRNTLRRRLDALLDAAPTHKCEPPWSWLIACFAVALICLAQAFALNQAWKNERELDRQIFELRHHK